MLSALAYLIVCIMATINKVFSSIGRTPYYKSNSLQIFRFPVPKDKRPWSVDFDEYKPTEFTFDHKNKPWSDPSDINTKGFNPKWNQLDGNVDRRSHVGPYIIYNGYPLNPLGRSGIKGKGILGRWGPNHAADPIVTRWKRNAEGQKIIGTNGPILEFVGIQRRDTREWAIPGGMIDPGEVVSLTLRREFCEETMNSLEMSESDRKNLEARLKKFFDQSGVEVYRGPVDDPRNTDNSWMETIVHNFHDESGQIVGQFNLNAGDDAAAVKWIEVNRNLHLYANHASFIEKVASILKSNW